MKKELLDEQRLINSAKADLSNFKLLYEKYVKVVFRYCYYRLGKNRELAEDITSETFMKAIDKFHIYEYRNKPFVVWLYAIAHNLIVDYYRDKKEQNISLDSINVNAVEETDEIIDNLSKEELKEQINKKAAELPDDLNNLFTLRHTEDLTFSEIGKLLGKTEGAVKMKYYRGLQALKALVADSGIKNIKKRIKV